MVLINLGSLSDSELRYIAQQEGFEDWETAERDDLTERLLDKYEEEDVTLPATAGSVTARKFMTSLTDFGMHASSSDSLPGVESLPDMYNDTSIHLLIRDPEWAYVFWSIAPSVREQFGTEDQMDVFLRVNETIEETGEKKFFDITVSLKDEEWNINLPDMNGTYAVSLFVQKHGEEAEELCASKPVRMYRPYLFDHCQEIGADKNTYLVQFSSMVTRGGAVADNPMMRRIVESFAREATK